MPLWTRSEPPKPPPEPEKKAPTLPAPLTCSFCTKPQAEVKKLIAGPNVHICDECIALCAQILDDEARKALPPAPATAIPLAHAIEAGIVGQKVACRSLGAALYQHQHAIHAPIASGPTRVLVIGPRGCGKSTLARAVIAAAKVPAYHADCSRMSETGYIGENIENVVGALLDRQADVEIARRGLIVFDSLHHLVRQQPAENRRDVAGREVQRDLVRLLDGMEIAATPNPKRHPQAPTIRVVADRMLIVAVATCTAGGSTEHELREHLGAQGFVDELISRFDRIVQMPPLGVAELQIILRRDLDALAAQIRPLGCALELRDGGAFLAEQAARTPDGAWALRPAVERLRERALMDPPRSYVLDAALAAELLAL